MCDSPAQSEALGLVLRVTIMQPEEYSHLEASWFVARVWHFEKHCNMTIYVCDSPDTSQSYSV